MKGKGFTGCTWTLYQQSYFISLDSTKKIGLSAFEKYFFFSEYDFYDLAFSFFLREVATLIWQDSSLRSCLGRSLISRSEQDMLSLSRAFSLSSAHIPSNKANKSLFFASLIFRLFFPFSCFASSSSCFCFLFSSFFILSPSLCSESLTQHSIS